MTEEQEKPCDMDDILCQMQILGHLKGMKEVLGEDKFKGRFPELEGLTEKLTERIGEQDLSLREALERCGLPEPGSIEPASEPEEE